MDYAFFRGVVVGFAIAAPIGPVGVLCIRRALADGRTAAFIASLGAAMADTLFGAVAGLGITLVSDFLLSQKTALSLVGGLALLAIGARTMVARPPKVDVPITGFGLVRDVISTFLLTLTNPATILGCMSIFAALGAARVDLGDGHALVTGVFVGSALWWLILSLAVGAIRHRFHARWIVWINRITGALLVVFGAAVLVGSFV